MLCYANRHIQLLCIQYNTNISRLFFNINAVIANINYPSLIDSESANQRPCITFSCCSTVTLNRFSAKMR